MSDPELQTEVPTPVTPPAISVTDTPIQSSISGGFDWKTGVNWAGIILSLLSDGLLSKIASLVLLIVTETYESKKRAREAEQKYELDQAQFEAMVQQAVLTMRVKNTAENTQVQTFEEALDQAESDELHKK